MPATPFAGARFARAEALNPRRSIDSSAEHKLSACRNFATSQSVLTPSMRVSAEHP